MQLIHKLRFALVVLVFAVWTTVAFAAATASLVKTPGGSQSGNAFNDANGKLTESRGGNTTWATTEGELYDLDPTATKSKGSTVIDNTKVEGLIVNAEDPFWVVELSASMISHITSHRDVNFTNLIETRARVALVAWEDVSILCAVEQRSSSAHAAGNYDIVESVDGVNQTVTNGGWGYAVGSVLFPCDHSLGILVDHYATAILGAGLDFTYESRAIGNMEIEFRQAGTESVSFSANQVGGQWSGYAVAWDRLQPNAVVVQAFALD